MQALNTCFQWIAALAIIAELVGSAAKREMVPEPFGQHATNQPALQPSALSQTHTLATQVSALGDNCRQCDECDETDWPRWYVQAETILLWRNNGTREEFLFPSTNLTTHGAAFDVGVGPQIVVGLRGTPNSAWEGKYFSVLEMDGVASGHFRVSSPTIQVNLDTDGNGIPDAYAGFMDFGDLVPLSGVQMQYQSALHNVEINYLRFWDHLSLLGGFRYVRLNENFEERLSFSDDGVWNDVYGRDTENNLYGAQLGARWTGGFERFAWEATGKAGLFGNHAKLSYSRNYESRGSSFDNSLAFVSDINASLVYRLSSVWGLRCGYNVMWISNVALAPNQPRYEDSTALATKGSVFLHGVNVGLEGQW